MEYGRLGESIYQDRDLELLWFKSNRTMEIEGKRLQLDRKWQVSQLVYNDVLSCATRASVLCLGIHRLGPKISGRQLVSVL
jgi:hypothetical protein